MCSRPRKQTESRIYHLISRGVDHCVIYRDRSDRIHFLQLLKDLSVEFGVAVNAWCLMDNHYHILATSEIDVIAKMMRRLNAAYALYFNTKYERDGHLFQGRFKSVPVESDEQFLTVLRYIHQNPEKAGICRTSDYPWSSYKSYLRGGGLASTAFALSLFSSLESFVAFHANLEQGEESGEKEMALAREALGGIDPRDIASLDRKRRSDALRVLKRTRLTVRQIEKMTGISRSTMTRA
ncbi:MAG: transposase [Coriobacteriia bacterium]|nr:transposase [Coriobacteriia bacterium]